MLAFTILLLGQEAARPGTESGNYDALICLARHQEEDGAWGSGTEACGCVGECPLETPLGVWVDARTRKSSAAYVRSFEQEEIEIREDAQDRIRALGARAIPALQRGLRNPDPEVALRCRCLLRRLFASDPEAQWLVQKANRQRSAAELESTGLALLGFLGAGYRHYSSDEVRDPVNAGVTLRFGQVVKKGITWLIQHQDESGDWTQGSPAARAIASLALNEAYAMTAAAFLKEPARLAYEGVLKDRCREERFLAWKALVLLSAQSNELGVGRPGDLRRLAEILSRQEGRLARTAAFLLKLRGAKTREVALISEYVGLDPSHLAPEELLFVTLGIYHWGGPEGWAWKKWAGLLRIFLEKSQDFGDRGCRWGSWTPPDSLDRIRTTALNNLSLMVYYRYRSHFGLMGYSPEDPAPHVRAKKSSPGK